MDTVYQNAPRSRCRVPMPSARAGCGRLSCLAMRDWCHPPHQPHRDGWKVNEFCQAAFAPKCIQYFFILLSLPDTPTPGAAMPTPTLMTRDEFRSALEAAIQGKTATKSPFSLAW